MKFYRFLYIILFILITNNTLYSHDKTNITLEEAISLAIKNYPPVKMTKETIKEKEYKYQATLGSYYPRLDFTSSERFINDMSLNDNYNLRQIRITLSQLLYDFGKRYLNTQIVKKEIDIEKLNENLVLLDLIRDVKITFYKVLALKELVEQKKYGLELATKNLKISQAKYDVGLAKKSDVLQSKVRLENAKIELRKVEGDYKNTLYFFNSLLGTSDLIPIGDLITSINLEPKNSYLNSVLNRPEIKKIEKQLELTYDLKNIKKTDFYPSIYLNLERSYAETHGTLRNQDLETQSIYFIASWNIFDYSKYYNIKITDSQIQALRYQLDEIKRKISLELDTIYEDIITSLENLNFAKEQLLQAEFNYNQAYNEYKVGTGDMLTLIQAEISLSNAKDFFIKAKENISINKVKLDYITGYLLQKKY